MATVTVKRTIECRLCKSLGHLSFHCPTKITRAETSETAMTQETPENTPIQANISKNSTPETPQSQASNNAKSTFYANF